MKKKILVYDASSVVRQYIVKTLKANGYDAKSVKTTQEMLETLNSESYNLLLYDMNNSDSLKYLEKVFEIRSQRVLLLGTKENNQFIMEALELGVIDSVYKPQNSVDIANIKDDLLSKIENSLLIIPKNIRKKVISFKTYETKIDTNIDMGFVLIGASTGGPRLIEKICKTLPKDYPHAVCVVQHMPTDFTANFARRLNTISKIEVVEADNGIELKKGRVIIAKGGKHMHIRKKLKSYVVMLVPNTRERFFTPSVDEMFLSAADVLPAKNILAVELTGIGDDGADGMVELRKKGAYTLAENEESAVVYGMPKEAYERGGAMKSLAFNDILDEIIQYGQKN